jgi:alkanesulfonate monooxygenase SsuD/methylene tetrahydromethanopterin reductase-like flavin-dependent oxidoreductase (luciferase family)
VTHIGVNLNNREALIAPSYGLRGLLDLAERVEELGFDSVWVGDSLFSKPRYEPLSLLAALAMRTFRVELGTACLVTAQRHPLQLAQAWSTVDQLSRGRTILGACAGNTAEEAVRAEFAQLGIDHTKRMSRFDEGLRILAQLFETGSATFNGKHFDLDDIGFTTGLEPAPLLPARRPPIWVVANPSIGRSSAADPSPAARRIAAVGDGWLTCCRARHPEEVVEFRAAIDAARAEVGRGGPFTVAYQVTMVLAEDCDAALADQRAYIDAYYPGFSDAVGLGDWGPAGTADDIVRWLTEFTEAGVGAFVCRFASMDQKTQVERFARDVLPRVRRASAR